MTTKKEIIKNWIMNIADNEDIISIVNSVNAWDGSLQDYEFYYMDSLDDIFTGVKPTELLNKLASNFDVTTDGYKDTICGLESCSEYEAVVDIKDNIDEVVNAIVETMEKTDLWLPSSLEELLEEE